MYLRPVAGHLGTTMSGMQVSTFHGVKIYNLSSGEVVPLAVLPGRRRRDCCLAAGFVLLSLCSTALHVRCTSAQGRNNPRPRDCQLDPASDGLGSSPSHPAALRWPQHTCSAVVARNVVDCVIACIMQAQVAAMPLCVFGFSLARCSTRCCHVLGENDTCTTYMETSVLTT